MYSMNCAKNCPLVYFKCQMTFGRHFSYLVHNKTNRMEDIHLYFWKKLEEDFVTVLPSYIKNGFQ